MKEKREEFEIQENSEKCGKMSWYVYFKRDISLIPPH